MLLLARMEPPHHMLLGGAEECHSSESGWTMYIGSPIHHEDGNYEDEGNNNNKVEFYQRMTQTQVDVEVESDDSMASDASSRPSHYINVVNSLGSCEGGYGLRHFKQNVEENNQFDHDVAHEYYCLDHVKKGSNKKENQIGETKGEKKLILKGSAQGGGGGGRVKVRKVQRVGTRK
ncbi:protein SOB FIVE-LIKE 3-like isoform X1 [Cicer arietinum]|uniref:Uncharacterized protein LOC101495171 isoform X1 n=2 Tax=Cicer arietinum TaxID=3827 RepID=A0A1S2XF41_CICAR|nr:uncharacterized protein LOC101495171 isoform X1 [Cicer arietinum]